MKIRTVQVSKPAKLNQVYSDFSSPDHAKYRVDLGNEAEALQKKVDSLGDEDRERYVTTFAGAWRGLDPTTRTAILGGAAGGVAGAGLGLASLSIKEIGRLVGGPVGFVVGLAALGIVTGALTPQALTHFNESKMSVSVQTPGAWNILLPQAKLEFEGATGKQTEVTGKSGK